MSFKFGENTLTYSSEGKVIFTGEVELEKAYLNPTTDLTSVEKETYEKFFDFPLGGLNVKKVIWITKK
ncbi:hypothetical protein [Maribacter sp. 2210JD10-5]|uniref:hypothetical protein n=1 Tax=Maribacter sp. 2210JD10-5 TaxID=3386272 RepID=UPI0039BD6A73